MPDNRDVTRWKMSRAATLGNRFEEDIVSQALEKERIPFLIRRYSDTAYDGLFIPQKGWAAVMVPHEFMDRAKALIEDLRKDFKIEESGVRSQESESQGQEPGIASQNPKGGSQNKEPS